MVTGEDEESIFGETGILNGVEQAADLSVEMSDGGAVIGEHLPDGLGAAWLAFEEFITDIHFAVIEGVARCEIGGQGNRAGMITGGKGGRILTRVVGGQVGEIKKKRSAVSVAAAFLEEVNGGIGEHLG